jgi:hypothetical protein
MHENRETSEMPEANRCDRPAGEGKSRTARVHVFEESDFAVVPMKSPNRAQSSMESSAAEVSEGRAEAKENLACARTCRTQSRTSRIQVPRAMRWPPAVVARARIQGRSRMR